MARWVNRNKINKNRKNNFAMNEILESFTCDHPEALFPSNNLYTKLRYTLNRAKET